MSESTASAAELYAAAFRRSASVVRHGCNVHDFGDVDTCSDTGADSGFASLSGSFDVSLDFAQSEVESDLTAILCCHLCGIGSVLFRAAEAHLASR